MKYENFIADSFKISYKSRGYELYFVKSMDTLAKNFNFK